MENILILGEFSNGDISSSTRELITVAKKLSPLFEIYNVAFCPHNFSIGPSLYASIHWAFSSIRSAWIEVPWVPENFGFDFSHPLPEIVNGRIQKPNGIGINLD